jgi:DNA excision repair protein ERCC-4
MNAPVPGIDLSTIPLGGPAAIAPQGGGAQPACAPRQPGANAPPQPIHHPPPLPDDYELCPFTILIDQQEGAPWRFSDLRVGASTTGKRIAVPTKRVHLKTGDYTIEGMEDRITIERKSHEDAWGSFLASRQRFERELERMQSMDFAAVVIEADWNRFLQPPAFSKGKPKSIFQSVLAWQQRFPKTHWLLMPNRRAAEHTAFWMLSRFWTDEKEGRHGAKT